MRNDMDKALSQPIYLDDELKGVLLSCAKGATSIEKMKGWHMGLMGKLGQLVNLGLVSVSDESGLVWLTEKGKKIKMKI